MADKDKLRFLTGQEANLKDKTLVRGQVYFAISSDTDSGKIYFDAPIDKNTTKRILMSSDHAKTADKATSADRATTDSNGRKFTETYVSEIKLDNAGTTILYKYPDIPTWKELKPKFLPLTGGTITGELYADSITAGDLLVNGSARFVNTILGNIETANQWKTARGFQIADSDAAHTSVSVNVNGSGNVVLKLPSTIKAALQGNADTATKATNDSNNKKITDEYLHRVSNTSSTLNQFSGAPKYLLGIESFTDGGEVKWQSVDSVKVGSASGADKWNTAVNFQVSDSDAAHTGTAVSVNGSKAIVLPLPATIKATLEGNASSATKLTNLTTADQASSTNTWRRVWFSYDDNVNGRPSYSDTFAYQSSTGTVKATKFQGALAGNATSADKWSTARNFITNLGSESSASVDGSTGPYNLGVTGTLPVSHGGTGNTAFTALRAIYAETATKLSSSGHYMSSNKLAINSTSEPDYNLYVNGSTYLNGKLYFPKDSSDSIWIGTEVNEGTTNLVFYMADDKVDGIQFKFKYWDNADATTVLDLKHDNVTISSHTIPAVTSVYNLGSTSYKWLNIYASNFRGLADKATSDGSGHNIEDTYLKRSGGTMTGTINSQIVQPKTNNTYTLGSSSNRWSTLYSVNIDNSGSWTWYGNQNFALKATANGQEWSFDQCSGSTSYIGTYSHFWSSKNSVSIIRFYTDDNQVQIPSTGFMGIGGAGDASYKLKVTGNTYLTGTLYVGGNATFNNNLTVNSGGKVKIQNTTDSKNSQDSNASLSVQGGVSVAKQLSAKTVRIDGSSSDTTGSTTQGCTVHFNKTNNCIEFVFD